MALDRWIALIILAICLLYGYAAMNYQLLPFERNMAFKPNTLPVVLSVLGGVLSIMVLFAPQAKEAGGDKPGDIDPAKLKDYNYGQAIGLLAAMVAYALALRPIGFIFATSLFLIGGSAILGERKFHFLIPIGVIAAFAIWYLVQELLGIFLRPWPGFLM